MRQEMRLRRSELYDHSIISQKTGAKLVYSKGDPLRVQGMNFLRLKKKHCSYYR
jgi:hypothetical protein